MIETTAGAPPRVPRCHWLPTPAGMACAALGLDGIAAQVPRDEPLRCPLLPLLHEAERRRFAQFPVHKRRVEWLAGRLAAKHALQRLEDSPRWPQQAQVRNGPQGRPAFECAQLSISHNCREAVAVVAHRPVGIDIETYDALRANSLAALLGHDEWRAVQRGWGCDAQVARTLLWCLKEALFKAAGQGGFVHFAMALQVLAWSRTDAQPRWHWRGAPLPDASTPTLAAWRADATLTEHAARVLVSPLVPLPACALP